MPTIISLHRPPMAETGNHREETRTSQESRHRSNARIRPQEHTHKEQTRPKVWEGDGADHT